MAVTTPVRIPSPEPSPPRVSQPVPVPTPEPVIPPSPVSVASRSTHRQVTVPPDSWIPVSDGDGIRIPPPHEFSPQIAYPTTLPPQTQPQPQPPAPASPTPPPAKSPSSRSILMGPPPTNHPIPTAPPPVLDPHHSDRDSSTSGTSYSPVMDRRESHHRRRRSSDSQTSTAMSQMDILGPPNPERDQRTLSSITEERASAMASPNNTPSVRVCFSCACTVRQLLTCAITVLTVQP